ncbi:hotdog fold thioesterase [Aliikangiella maris]|uniref:Hotdog fold thioesterase n=2 Tax=Aliikangiella maris TaxID=3162458 RepID=A0ABV3ML92_9GAMM
MKIWKKPVSIEALQAYRKDTMVENLGIDITEIGDDYIIASMPVDRRTHQPRGILHGGASIALAETVGSIAANLAVDESQYCVGLEVNGNHLRSISTGLVFAKASPAHLGRTTQVWEILITDELNNKICLSRLTIAVLNQK